MCAHHVAVIRNLTDASMSAVCCHRRRSAAKEEPTREGAIEQIARLFPRKRSRLVVEIDLDPVPGWGNRPEHHRALVQQYLNDTVGHYRPTVTVDPA